MTGTPLRIAILPTDGFALSVFANFVEILRLADEDGAAACDWFVLSEDMSPIRASCGLTVNPDRSLRDAGICDYVVVIGGKPGALSAEPLAFLRTAASAGTPLAGLGTGVFSLAEAGLLDGYRCAVGGPHRDFSKRFARVTPISDQLVVADRNRLTSAGSRGAAHLAALLIARHIGKAAAARSLRMLIAEDTQEPAPSPGARIRDTLVRRTLRIMQQNLETPKTMAEIARDMGIGRRQIERHFRADLGQSPQSVYTDLRLDQALSKLRGTGETISDIALSCGFCDSSHFVRLMKARHGMTPSEFRTRHVASSSDPRPG